MLLLVPLAMWIAWRTRQLEPAARWLLTLATAMLTLAAIGVQVRCNRTLTIVAMVDVSPSTRGATFRDPKALEAKLRQLTPRRTASIRYFADGIVAQATEAASTRSTLPEMAADAVLLFSDGRIDAAARLAPVYAVVDPALNAAVDARVEEVRTGEAGATVTTFAATAGRKMRAGTADVVLPAGPLTTIVPNAGRHINVKIDAGDSWPENDAMSAVQDAPASAAPWFIESADQLPADPVSYLDPPAIVVPASLPLSAIQQQRLTQYVRDLGGTLIVTGSPTDYAAALKPLMPLAATPPEPTTSWLVLLDASGSMASPTAGRSSRWEASIAAAASAVEKLDEQERVSAATFARAVDPIVIDATPAAARASLGSIRTRVPGGPTGMQAALESAIASAKGRPTRLLIVSDADVSITDPASLAARLRDARISVFLLATTIVPNDSPLRTICDDTGGRLSSQADPLQWVVAAESLVAAARGKDAIEGDFRPTLQGITVDLSTKRRFRSFAKANADVIANVGDEPVAARWQAGLGQAISVAAEIDRSRLAALASSMQRAPIDPRFQFAWDERNETVTVAAADQGAPLNDLAITLRRNDRAMPFLQVAPGQYRAAISRSGEPSIAIVEHAGRVIGRRAVASRYAPEFDRIGNDLTALRALAARTGGRLIEPGDASPIEFPNAAEWRSTRAWLAAIGAVVLLLAIVLIRAPYLVDRIAKRRFKP